MGPAATLDFYDKLIRATPATRDQDHVRVTIWADPTVPDRSEALHKDGTDPSPWLEAGIQRLVDSGCDVLACPCNTAHPFLPALLEGKDIEFVSIVDAALHGVIRGGPPRRVGVLTTDGTRRTGIYQDALNAAGYEPVLLSDSGQDRLTKVIYDVKAGCSGAHGGSELTEILEEFRIQGVTTAIAGCTELSVIRDDVTTNMDIIDSSQELAVKTVERAAISDESTNEWRMR